MKSHRHAPKPAPPANRHSIPRSLLTVIGLVFVSRLGYHLAGVRFDASSLSWFWQFVDPALLRSNLAQSLWHLHSQPPAFNAFLGVVLRLFTGHETVAFTVSYLFAGLVFTVALFLLLSEFGLPDKLNLILTGIYVVSPACVLYENWLFYTYPLTVLLLLTALFWTRFIRRGRLLDAVLLFTAAGLLALTWSLFHLVWLLGLAFALVLFRRKDWRTVMVAAAVPLLFVALWYGKNLLQVGEFTGSTWFGINFSKMTNSMLTIPERETLYGSGTISAVSLVPPFSDPDKYYGALPKPVRTGIPVLDQETKPSGVPNFNNALFVAVSRQYGRDARRILAAQPTAYLRGLAESYLIYYLPANAYLFLDNNAARIRGLTRLASILDGRFFYHSDRSLRLIQPGRYYLQGLLNTGWLLILAYVLVLAAGFVLLLRPSPTLPRPSSLFFLWFNVVWVTFVANALEVGENNRFRFVVDPLVFAFLAALVSGWVARQQRKDSGSLTQKTGCK